MRNLEFLKVLKGMEVFWEQSFIPTVVKVVHVTHNILQDLQ